MSVFNKSLEKYEDLLSLPYPEKRHFIKELRSDMESHYADLIKSGVDEKLAKLRVCERINLSGSDISTLEAIHTSKIFSLYKEFSFSIQQRIELCIAFFPIFIFSTYLFMEVKMLHFLEMGGFAVYPILVLGALTIIMQLRMIFSWFVARNHSKASLRQRMDLITTLGVGTFLIGFFGTAWGAFMVFSNVLRMSSEHSERFELLMIGLSECLVPTMLASIFVTASVLLHLGIKYGVKHIGLPVSV